MYLDYYGLKKQPFSISPDPDFIWLSQKHAEAFSTLKYGILEDKGFLVLTGDIGTGKTLLIKNLEKNIPIPTIIVNIPDPDMGTLEFFNYLAEEIQMNKKFRTKGDFLIHFKNFLHQAYGTDKKVLLILDEAQRLNFKLLEEIRLLSNLEMTNRKLLNIFFVGQNEFAEMLKDTRSRAVRQRIIVGYHLDPFNKEETSSYISHRLKVAGAQKEIFSADATGEIFAFSVGYPRLINILCDNALLYGWSAGLKVLDADVIRDRAKELRIEKPIRKQKEKKIAEKSATEVEEIIRFDYQAEETTRPGLHIEETKKYESQIEEEKGEQPIVEVKNERDEIKENQEFNNNEREETKALIPIEIQKEKSVPIFTEVFKYTVIAVFIFAIGATVSYFYNSKNNRDLQWSIDEIAPKQKFFVQKDKKLSVAKEETIKSEAHKNNLIQNNVSNQFEEKQTKRNKDEIIAKSIIEPGKKRTDKKFQQEPLISKPEFKGSTVEKDVDDRSADKQFNHSDAISSLLHGQLLGENIISIYFTHDTFNLSESSFTILDKVVKFAAAHSKIEITVDGYTDSFGNYWYNQKLSQLRANAVKDYLVEKGISPSRIKATGKGQVSPVGNNETTQGRRQNRRVEIKFYLADN